MDWTAIGAIASIACALLALVGLVIPYVVNRPRGHAAVTEGRTDPKPKTPSQWKSWLQNRFIYVSRGFRLKAVYRVTWFINTTGPLNKPEIHDERNGLEITIVLGEPRFAVDMASLPGATVALSYPFESAEHFLARLFTERKLLLQTVPKP